MELRDIFAALRHRWYLTVAAILTSAAAALYTYSVLPPTFSTDATVVLIPPETTTNPGSIKDVRTNPLLYLGGLTQSRDVVLRVLNEGEVADELARQVPNASYEVAPDPNSSGPIIVITAEAATAQISRQAVQVLLQQVPVQLGILQKRLGVEAKARITSLTVTDGSLHVKHTGQVRGAILSSAAVALAFFVLIGLLEGLSRARGGREPRRRTHLSRRGAARAPAPAAPAAGSERTPAQTPDSSSGDTPLGTGMAHGTGASLSH